MKQVKHVFWLLTEVLSMQLQMQMMMKRHRSICQRRRWASSLVCDVLDDDVCDVDESVSTILDLSRSILSMLRRSSAARSLRGQSSTILENRLQTTTKKYLYQILFWVLFFKNTCNSAKNRLTNTIRIEWIRARKIPSGTINFSPYLVK